MKTRLNQALAAAVLALAPAALAADAATQPAAAPAAAPTAAARAVAVLHGASGSKVAGTIWFTDKGGSIEVKVDVTGLTPGKHGFHVHEAGDCTAPDATSAGGHFNPGSHPHAAREAAQRHAGDLGNLEADKDGKASATFDDKSLKLTGDGSIIGRGVIVHANPDDFTTQPTGNAGGRVACGTIGWAK